MKKSTRILSAFLCIVTLFSMFAISAGAVSSSSSKTEILNYYEKSVKTTATIEVVKTKNTDTRVYDADMSKLSERDRKKTTEEYFTVYDIVLGEENVSNYELYYYGDSEDKNFDGASEIEHAFSIKRRMNDYGHSLKSATYKKESNGNQTMVFTCNEAKYDGGAKESVVYTVKVNKWNVVYYFKFESKYTYTETSIDGVDFTCVEKLTDVYNFYFKKKDVTSISLSETEVTVPYGKTVEIDVIINPSDADFKGFWVDHDSYGDNVFATEDLENSKLIIEGLNRGTETVDIYSYDGEYKASVKVTVKMSIFDMIIKFFKDLFASFIIF